MKHSKKNHSSLRQKRVTRRHRNRSHSRVRRCKLCHHVYHQKGCSCRTCDCGHTPPYLHKNGGSRGLDDAGRNLAYTGQPVASVPNPHLAYQGRGGKYSSHEGVAKAYPVHNLPLNSQPLNWLNSQMGGTCGACSSGIGPMMMPHQMGGAAVSMPYPNGLVGNTWSTNVENWPGVNGVSGDYNHYQLNTYKNDVPNQMIATGAQPPFSVGGRRSSKYSRRHSKKHRGGSSNSFLQDGINLGRQFTFNVQSAYNALNGYPQPVNPLPWKDQLQASKLSTL